MRLVNAAFIAATLIFVVGGYLQERKRLATIRELSPARARELFETGERRRDRTMRLVTAALVVGAVVALAVRGTR
jgi:hypothetical protein